MTTAYNPSNHPSRTGLLPGSGNYGNPTPVKKPSTSSRSSSSSSSVPKDVDPIAAPKVTKEVSAPSNPLEAAGVPEDLLSDLDFDVSTGVLSNNELIDTAGDKAKQQMTGEIPLDVREQIEDLANAQALRGGIGMGEAGRKLVARDFGLTSMDITQRGIENTLQVTQARNQVLQLEASVVQDRRNYALALGDLKINQDQLALMGSELVSRNQQYIMGLVNSLVIANSQNEIQGVQGNVDTLLGNTQTGQAGYLDATNDSIIDVINKYGG